MLVLTRKAGEAIFIGEDVKIVIVQIKGGQVQIGIEAPKTVHIKREEITNGQAPTGGKARQNRKWPP